MGSSTKAFLTDPRVVARPAPSRARLTLRFALVAVLGTLTMATLLLQLTPARLKAYGVTAFETAAQILNAVRWSPEKLEKLDAQRDLLKARIALRRGDLGEAERLWKKGISRLSRHKDIAKAYFDHSFALDAAKLTDRAIEYCRKVLELDPKNLRPLL